jgi:serine/threonine-protein kinase
MNNCPNCNNPYQTSDEVCRTCGFILPITSPTIAAGEVLQTRYEIQELVHSGGMGYVYLATDKRLYDRICIVKQVKEPIKSDAHRKKLEEEALRMSKLHHPNVAMILDHFIDGGYYFLIVEYIYGKTLSEVFKERRGHLTENEVVIWATSICDVVSYLHSEGIVHRDISPDNIMLTGEGSIKFIDFGTLREFRYIAPGGTVGIGKYGYTPPEQWQGKPEFRSDIFSLGATIYYLMSGFLPLSREYTTKQAPQKEDFNPIFPPIRTKSPNVSPQLEAALEKALQLDINDRYASAAEFGEALRNLGHVEVKVKKKPALSVKTKPKAVEAKPKPIRKPKPIGKPKPKISSRWAVIALGIVLFLIAAAGGVYFVSGHPFTPSSTSPETTTPTRQPTPAPPAELSFAAKTYTNDQYGFSIQYPDKWVERPDMITVPAIHKAFFSVEGFVPGVACMVYDNPEAETKDWIVESFKMTNYQMPKVTSDIKEITLADGTKAYTYKAGYVSATGYAVAVYVVDADKDGKRIRVNVYTVEAFASYDEKLFSEIAHSLRFTSPQATTVPRATEKPPVVSVDSSPTELISFEDDFSNANSGWPLGPKDWGEFAYESGEYSVLIKKVNSWGCVTNLSRIGVQKDFTAEVDVRKLSQGTDDLAGIAFRWQSGPDGANLYLFSVNNNNGSYRIGKVVKNEWATDIIGPTQSNHIKRDTNRLKVVCQGSQIEVYVNGHKLVTRTDTLFTSGYVGLAVTTFSDTDTHYHFDNFKIYAAE